MLRKVIPVVLVASAAAALTGLSSGGSARALAARSGHIDRNGRIAFTYRTPGRPTNILTIEPDGSDVRQLTDTPAGGVSGDPAWTPKGNRILFDSDRADGFPHLFSMNPNGEGIKQLTSGTSFECCASMSPNGDLIAFNGADCGDCPGGSFPTQGIYLVGRKGGDFSSWQRVTLFPGPDPDGADDEPDFSPDGTKIAFVRQTVTRNTAPAALAAVFVIGVDGSGLTQVTPYELDAEYPRWSPDGTRIVFDSNADNFPAPQHLYVVSADGSGLTQLTDEANNRDFHADWSPDGSKLAFARHTSGVSHIDLDVLDADGANVTTIWRGAHGASVGHLSWGTRP
jgi:TolB protein